MKPKTVYLIVEGPHDSSVVARIIRKNGLGVSPVRLRNEVPSYWDPLIPKTFPGENDDGEPEFGRVQVPDFLKTVDQMVAIQSAGGIDKLPGILMDDLELLELHGKTKPDAIGIIIDADSGTAADAYTALIAALGETGLQFADKAGEVTDGPPRVGVYVLPDNNRSGTLEDTMLESASSAYPQLLPLAETIATTVRQSLDAKADWLPSPERDDFNKPAGMNKTRVSVLGAVMKPTYAIGNSYRQQSWITAETLKQPLLGQLSAFLTNLIGDR
jgi:hypothetical protein